MSSTLSVDFTVNKLNISTKKSINFYPIVIIIDEYTGELGITDLSDIVNIREYSDAGIIEI